LIDKKNIVNQQENAILVGVIQPEQTDVMVNEYIDELEFLAETAGVKTIKRFTQRLKHPDARSFVGKGKLEEIKKFILSKGNITLVVFDDELTGSQIQNIEKEINTRTIDRSDLILDIFASRAKTAQARTQVELAQYQYILPRLKGMWKHLERQGGGVGTRGPGETEIETDRRIVKDKISLLKKRLEDYDRQAMTQRQERGEFIRVALVGYTNVGKSTIMNGLSKSEVFAENKLFATLDTTTRKCVFEQTPFLLSDTVGFIRKLPHHLVESFKSTLDEVREADVLLHVVDIAHPQYEEQLAVVNKTLAELGCAEKPTITIFNKMDKFEEVTFDEWLEEDVKKDIMRELKERWEETTKGNCVFVSAIDKKNFDTLRQTILNKVREMYQIRYPYKAEYFY
jgi:GTP-binding protein HflX